MKKKFFSYEKVLSVIILSASILSPGCSQHVSKDVKPLVEASNSYSIQSDNEGKADLKWWRELKDSNLDDLIEKALKDNFTLKGVYARMKQAESLRRSSGAALKPELSGELSHTSRWNKDGDKTDSKALKMALAWEVDLWNKLSSAEKAAAIEYEAKKDELDGAALILSAEVADVYFSIIERRDQMTLLNSQIDVSETFLELAKFRFSHGAASLVDIHQQRQQLASLKTQLPKVRSRLATLKNRLYLLLGKVPSKESMIISSDLPALPDLPGLGIPADLLMNRPDLKRHYKKLVAADFRVAQAVAERLPSLRIGAAIGIQGASLGGDNRFHSIVGDLAGPIVDWGRRKAEVRKREAIVEEEIASYTQAYLVAIEEVENALVEEIEQVALIDAIGEQLAIAKANLSETRNRYAKGLSDYLPVLTALQSKQRLERDILLEKKELISIRIILYRALGGGSLLSGGQPLLLNEKGKYLNERK